MDTLDPRPSTAVRFGHRLRRLLPGSMLGLALVIQLALLIDAVVYPVARQVWDARTLPKLDRSAEIAFGSEFADYLRFVRATVPPEGRVVLPRMESEPVYGNIGMMQYFLIPREVVNCPGGAGQSNCLQSLRGSSTYILAIDQFPPKDDVPNNKILLEHSPGLGIYVPTP